MRPRAKAALLWGLVGGLSFLVLVQGFRLATGRAVQTGVVLGVALVVGVGASAVTYALEGRLGTKEQS
jgi:hypothetical protein